MEEKKMNSQQIEGRNAVMEAFRSGKTIDKVYILDGCQDGPIRSIVREAKKHDTILNFDNQRTSEPDFRDRKTSGGHCTGSGLRVCAGGRYAGACKTERGRSFPDPSGQY